VPGGHCEAAALSPALAGPPVGEDLLDGVKLPGLHRLPAVAAKHLCSAREAIHANRVLTAERGVAVRTRPYQIGEGERKKRNEGPEPTGPVCQCLRCVHYIPLSPGMIPHGALGRKWLLAPNAPREAERGPIGCASRYSGAVEFPR